MLNGKLWIIALLVGAISIMVIACGGGGGASKEPIVLIEQDWDGSLVTTEVAKIILEREMGFTVEKSLLQLIHRRCSRGWKTGTCTLYAATGTASALLSLTITLTVEEQWNVLDRVVLRG